MHQYPTASVRLWRTTAWHPNSLKRDSDRLETAILALAVLIALVAVPLAAAFGTVTFSALDENAARQAAAAHAVTATIGSKSPDNELRFPSFPTAVSWIDNGQIHTATIDTDLGTQPGEHLQVWVDQRGDRVAEPLTAADVVINAASAAILTWLAVVGALYAAVAVAQRFLNRRRHALWAQEWLSIQGSAGFSPH